MKPRLWFTALSLPALFALVEASDNTLWGNHACLLALLLLAILALASAIYGLCVIHRQRLAGLVHLTLGMLFLAIFFGYFRQGGDGTVTRSVLNDGTEIEVRQRHSGSLGEPYYVDLAVRRPGHGWRTWYVDHQDIRWWFGFIHHNHGTQIVHFGRLLSEIGRIDLSTGELVLARRPGQEPSTGSTETTTRTRPNHERQTARGASLLDAAYRNLSELGTGTGLLASGSWSPVQQSVPSHEVAPAAPSAGFTCLQSTLPSLR